MRIIGEGWWEGQEEREGREGFAAINLSLTEGSQNGRSAVCVLTTNHMTLNTTARAKNLTFKNSFLIPCCHPV